MNRRAQPKAYGGDIGWVVRVDVIRAIALEPSVDKRCAQDSAVPDRMQRRCCHARVLRHRSGSDAKFATSVFVPIVHEDLDHLGPEKALFGVVGLLLIGEVVEGSDCNVGFAAVNTFCTDNVA